MTGAGLAECDGVLRATDVFLKEGSLVLGQLPGSQFVSSSLPYADYHVGKGRFGKLPVVDGWSGRLVYVRVKRADDLKLLGPS